MQKWSRRSAGLPPCAVFAALLAALLPIAARADDASRQGAQLDKLYDQVAHGARRRYRRMAINQQIWRLWIVPTDPDLAGKMSAVLATEQTGNLPMAMMLVGKIITQYPSYAEGWNQRATMEYELRDFDDSLADIDKVLALEPRHFGALSGRVLVYLAEGNRPMALKAVIAALAVDPFLAERALFPELSVAKTQAEICDGAFPFPSIRPIFWREAAASGAARKQTMAGPELCG